MHGLPASSALAAFLASFVEFVEALTVVLAVGSVRGWRSALTGAAAALVPLAFLVIIFGSSLTQFPVARVKVVVGTLVLLFGSRWLRKAILRSAGVLTPHDEEKEFVETKSRLSAAGAGPHTGIAWVNIDLVGFLTALKAVFLEGVEVVFIVVAAGGVGGNLWPASCGAIGAALIVFLLGIVVHKPLSRIPENMLKFTVGLLLCTFGIFWLAEGLSFDWPGEDLALVGNFVGLSLLAFVATRVCRAVLRRSGGSKAGKSHFNFPILNLFIGDGHLALAILLLVLTSAYVLPTMFSNSWERAIAMAITFWAIFFANTFKSVL